MTSSEPLRALFVNENLGGHATAHLHLARALREHPEVAATFVDVPLPRLARRLAAVPVPGLGRLDLDLQPTRYQLAQSAHVRRLLPAWSSDADVMHLYTHNVALLSADLLRARPSLVSLDATNAQNAFNIPYRTPTRFTARSVRPAQRLERRVYEAATFVVTHSAWAASSVQELGIDPEKVHVIPFGIRVPDLPEVDRPELPQITFIGAGMERKGGWRLLEVFRRHFRGRATLTLITRDAVAPEEGVEVLRDVVPGDARVPSLLARTSVFVFPTAIDAFGYAPLEAMAMAAPVVASSYGALPEIVEDGVTGTLVPRFDDEALVAAIRDLLDDPARAAEMGRAGRRRVLERFDARRTTEHLVSLLLAAPDRHAALA